MRISRSPGAARFAAAHRSAFLLHDEKSTATPMFLPLPVPAMAMAMPMTIKVANLARLAIL